MEKSNLVKLAKNSNNKKSNSKKNSIVDKKLSPKDEIEIKAKKKVDEILGDDLLIFDATRKTVAQLSTDENDNIELDDKSNKKGIEWLTEEITKLTNENEILKEEYNKLFNEYNELKKSKEEFATNESDLIKNGLIRLFNELQDNYMRNPGLTRLGTPNFIIFPVAFMERMIMFFPFLEKERRYNL